MNVRQSFATAFAAAFAAALVLAACEKSPAPAPAAPPPAPEATATPPAPATTPEATAPQPGAQAPQVTGFTHDANRDLFGYYIPEGEVKFGKWQFTVLSIATPQDFINYEKGQRDPPEYAPVLLEFDDVTSPEATNELGGTYRTNQRRVLPAAYLVSGDRVVFAGKDAELGDIWFEGKIDVKAVKRATAAQGQGPSDTSIVLTGKLTIGSETRDVKFTWFGGD